MFLEQTSKDRFIGLRALAELLLLEDTRSVLRWCDKKGISTQTGGNKKVVHLFLVEIELDRELIVYLKSKYPNTWEDLYKCYLADDRLAYLHLTQRHHKIRYPIASRSKAPVSKIAKEFIKSQEF